MSIRKVVVGLLITAGIAIMAVPFFWRATGEKQTEQLISEFEQTLEDDYDEETDVEEKQTSISKEDEAILKEGGVIGIIEIPGIDIRYPVMEGTTSKVLNAGIGHIEETAGIGESGNCVLCGHNGYVVAYDRANGAPASIFERCAGVYYIDENVVILCDLMDSGEISRNVYKTPVRGWTEEGFRTLANYVGRIRGSLPFSKLILDSCAGRGAWKNPAECTANLRCCDWEHKMLAYQQKGTVLWRNFAGKPVSALGKL